MHRSEDEAGKLPSARIAIRLFHALDDAAQVGMSDLLEFARLANVEATSLDRSGKVHAIRSAAEPLSKHLKSVAERVGGWNDAINSLPPDWQEPVRKLGDLVDRLGTQRTLDLLTGLAVATAEVPEAITDSEISITHPPREIDLGGAKAIEQVTTTYAKSNRDANPRGTTQQGKSHRQSG